MKSMGSKTIQQCRTSAIFIVTIAGLWLGLAGVAWASVESGKVPVQTSRPSAEDCAAAALDGYGSVVDSWSSLMSDHSILKSIALGEFKTRMDSLLTSPESIHCRDENGRTVAHLAVGLSSVEGARWAVSKGVDVTIKDQGGHVAYEDAQILAYLAQSGAYEGSVTKERMARMIQVAPIVTAPATKPCAEVDGQTPPANEYCIVAENSQSSRGIKLSNDLEKSLAGGSDYRYATDKPLSGTGLYPGWKSTITFTCSSVADPGCGYADYVIHERTHHKIKEFVRNTCGLGIGCGESGDLLDLDRDLEPGESISLTRSSDTERSSPLYLTCRGWALDPFTVSIGTTRLA